MGVLVVCENIAEFHVNGIYVTNNKQSANRKKLGLKLLLQEFFSLACGYNRFYLKNSGLR